LLLLLEWKSTVLTENANDAYHYTPFEKSFKYLSKKKSKTFSLSSKNNKGEYVVIFVRRQMKTGNFSGKTVSISGVEGFSAGP
jgi:hypothetical protein